MTDIAERMNQYFRALGKFCHHFAEVEAQMQFVLWKHTGAHVSVCQSIFSGTRAKEAISYTKRIREAKELPESPELTSAFTQPQIMNDVRNQILHYGINISDEGMVSTNLVVAHAPRSLKEVPISAQILDDMTFDLQTIVAKLVVPSAGSPGRGGRENRPKKGIA